MFVTYHEGPLATTFTAYKRNSKLKRIFIQNMVVVLDFKISLNGVQIKLIFARHWINEKADNVLTIVILCSAKGAPRTNPDWLGNVPH